VVGNARCLTWLARVVRLNEVKSWSGARQHQLAECPDQRIESIWRIARRRSAKIRRERTHLIFEGREASAVVNLVLFVESADRFGARGLPTARLHSLEAHVRID
jgi:hypothetical protein